MCIWRFVLKFSVRHVSFPILWLSSHSTLYSLSYWQRRWVKINYLFGYIHTKLIIRETGHFAEDIRFYHFIAGDSRLQSKFGKRQSLTKDHNCTIITQNTLLLVNYISELLVHANRQAETSTGSIFDLLKSVGCSGFSAFISDIRIWGSTQDAGSHQHHRNTRCQNLTSTPQSLEFISEFAGRIHQVFNVLTVGKLISQV